MNFEQFRSKLKASAVRAVDAARTIPTFDEMAARDDYVHSEDLNVRRKHDRRKAAQRQQAPQRSASLVEDSSRSCSSPSHSSPPLRSSSNSYLSVVTDTLQQTSAHSKQRNNTTKEDSHDRIDKQQLQDNQDDRSSLSSSSSNSNSSSEDDEEDPILSMIQPNRPNKRNNLPYNNTNNNRPKPDNNKTLQPRIPTPTATQPQHSLKAEPTQKRNPNRFMEDLDQRLSAPLELESQTTPTSLANGSRTRADNSQSPQQQQQQPLGWLRTGLQQMLQTRPVQRIPPEEAVPLDDDSLVSPPPLARKRYDEKIDNADHEHTAVVSSSVLGADELAQLASLQQPKSLCSTCWEWQLANPRFSFIAFTLLLSIVVYFFMRNRSNDADVV